MQAYAATPGNRGAWMLQRPVGELMEFVTFSLWDSIDAIKAFAGYDYETAVFYPEDDRFLVERDEQCHALGGRAHGGWLAWRAMSDATNGAGRALVSVVVPVFNEERTVAQVVDELLELPLTLEVLLVDDGSTDDSPAELARLAATHRQVTVHTQPPEQGQGRGRAARHRRVPRRHPADPGRRPRVLAVGHPGADRPAAGRQGRRRLRHAPARRRAPAARAPLLALRRQPLPDAALQRPLQHDDLRHGGRLQGLPTATSCAAWTLISDDFRIEPELTAKILRLGARRSASTRSRSPTTAAPTPRARRSRGATASAPSARSSASASSSPPPWDAAVQEAIGSAAASGRTWAWRAIAPAARVTLRAARNASTASAQRAEFVDEGLPRSRLARRRWRYGVSAMQSARHAQGVEMLGVPDAAAASAPG